MKTNLKNKCIQIGILLILGIGVIGLPSLDAKTVFRIDFNRSEDTARFAVENVGTGNLPGIDWIEKDEGDSGLLKINFLHPDKGIKLTLKLDEWISTENGQWYEMRIRVRSVDTNKNSILMYSFLYNGILPGPTDISGYGMFSIPAGWFNLTSFQKSKGGQKSTYPQITIWNKDKYPVSVYLDSIEIETITLPPVEKLSWESSDFNTVQDLQYWQPESVPVNVGMPSRKIIMNHLEMGFSGMTIQGVKMTMGTQPGVTYTMNCMPGKLVGQEVRLQTTEMKVPGSFMIAAYSTAKPGSTELTDIGFFIGINRFQSMSSDIYQVFMIPSKTYFYGQFISTSSSRGKLIVDDFYPLIDSHVFLDNLNPELWP